MKLIYIFSITILFYKSLFAIDGDNELKLPPILSTGLYPTLNKMGWVSLPHDKLSKAFIEDAVLSTSASLELGAGYGFSSKEILEKTYQNNNKKIVIINDIDERHLNIAKIIIGESLYSRLYLCRGNFLYDLKILPNSIGSILASRIFIMLKGNEIEHIIKNIVVWLKPGGKFFILSATPYRKPWNKFLSEYENRKKMGSAYPGEITNPPDWCTENINNLPNFIHLLDIDILVKILINHGFSIQTAEYLPSENLANKLLIGEKDNLAIVAYKPMHLVHQLVARL